LDGIRAAAARLPRRPRVYFEEWDQPQISAIRWVSELIGVAGGDDVFPELAAQSLGRDRIIADPLAVLHRAPDLIFGSGAGRNSIRARLQRGRAGSTCLRCGTGNCTR
jgi:iron complex transport system substrate-binding protein